MRTIWCALTIVTMLHAQSLAVFAQDPDLERLLRAQVFDRGFEGFDGFDGYEVVIEEEMIDTPMPDRRSS